MENRSATWIANQAEILSAPSELTASVESLEPVAGADPIARRWIIGNQKIVNNLVEARLESPFDPTRTTLPIQSSMLKIENATNYDVGLPPVEDYDFAQDANMSTIQIPITVDAFIRSDGEAQKSWNNGVHGQIVVGSAFTGLIKPDLSSVPVGATITDASLSAYVSAANTGTQTVSVYRLLKDWGEGDKLDAPATTGESNWTYAKHDTSAWATAGAKGLADRATTASSSLSVDAATIGWRTFTGLQDDVQAWLDGDEDEYGWGLYGTSANYALFSSSDGSNAPVLTVVYGGLDNMRALGFPTTINGELGFRYSDGSVERRPAFRHSLTDATLDDFNTYVTLNGESFLSQLDKGVFYGGRYDAAGIDAATVIAEILEDVTFKGEGGWNYVIGSANCVTSATLPLWADSGFDYWIIDPELARFKLFIPVPPVSHRQALQYVAAYVGADVWVNRNGQIVVSRGLYAGDAPDYTLDIGRVYDRPKRIRPLVIGTVESKLTQYNPEASASEISNVTVVVPSGDAGETKLYRLTHDACHEGSLALTGATLVGSPTYYAYSTEFLASSTNATFTAVLTGKKVELVERVVTFPFVEGGSTATYSNPIASDVTYLHSAIHEYVRMATAPQYEIAMRDDPAIDNGDRVMLEQIQNANPTPVIVGNISREMSGSLDAKYTLYENRNRYVEDFSSLEDAETVIGYDGWASSDPLAGAVKGVRGGSPVIVVTTENAEISHPTDLRLGTPLHFVFGGIA